MFDIKSEAKKLVAGMTLDEKVSQMLHGAAAVDRLGIPAYNWWSEALHGVARAGTATMFPQAVALACMFDEDAIEEVAKVISDEARAKYMAFQEEDDKDIYKGLTLWSPNINIFRDPRWGRGHETYGEDPYLTSRLGVRFIKGLQGDKDVLKTAACAKHYAVHSGPEAVRHEFNAECNQYDLWNTYLPAFEAAVKEAKVEIVMGAYNRTNGEPCCGSKTLLQDILRVKWGFDGHVTSDCWAVRDFHLNHKVTATPVESVSLAVKNGCDLNCGNMYGYCLAAVEEGLLTEDDIDTAVIRLITTRMRLGLLGAPSEKTYEDIPFDVIDCKKHREFNREISRKCPVLLKNDDRLPFDTNKIKTIGVIGPNADSRRALEGNYQGTASDYITLLQGMRLVGDEKGVDIKYAEGCHLFREKMNGLSAYEDRISEAVSVAKHSDAVVICLGLDADIEGEEGDTGNQFASGDKTGLGFVGQQDKLLKAVCKAAKGKPVILVVISGSAMDLSWASDNVNGIVQAFYPGSQGGLAIAEILFGKHNPEGKLPVTIYRSDSDLPDFCDYSMENRTYRYFKGEPLYPFGFGLSYTDFNVTAAKYDNGEVTCTVANNGKMAGNETVQVYAEVENTREQWNLCGIGKVNLAAGESMEVKISVNPNAFKRYDNNGDLYEPNGKKYLYVGVSQPDKRSAELCGKTPVRIDV